MGYNTWNDLECKPTEKKVQKIADKLKKLNFLSLGYQYFTIDDCWMDKVRDSKERLAADQEAFPNGMAKVGEYLHKLGFKFGIYTDRGPNTCVGLPGSMGFEEKDAKTFAEWGVDLVKNDGCWDPECGTYQPTWPGSGTCDSKGRKKAIKKYIKMFHALNKTGRQIVHMVCGWQPWYAPVGRSVGHTWRVAADVREWEGVYETTRIMEQMSQFHGPNGWNDPDMLLGSSAGAQLKLTPLQARAQFTLWVVMAAPLMIGADVLHMSGWDIETYTNKEAIRVNQDPLGMQGKAVISNCPEYPGLALSVEQDGNARFSITNPWLFAEEVVCGSHSAKSCAECPQGHGEGWCHGDCRWIKSSKRCIPLEVQVVRKPKTPPEDIPEPWQIGLYRKPEMRQCQQVWMKPLQGGDFAVAVINFASEASSLNVLLQDLGLPWQEPSAIVHDLWYKGAVLNPYTVSGSIQMKLKAEGGHALLRLQRPPNSSLASAVPKVIASSTTPLGGALEEEVKAVAPKEGFGQASRRSSRKRITDDMLTEAPEIGDNGLLVPLSTSLVILILVAVLLVSPRSLRSLRFPDSRPGKTR